MPSQHARQEIRSQKSFDLSKILDEIDKFEFVRTLPCAQHHFFKVRLAEL